MQGAPNPSLDLDVPTFAQSCERSESLELELSSPLGATPSALGVAYNLDLVFPSPRKVVFLVHFAANSAGEIVEVQNLQVRKSLELQRFVEQLKAELAVAA